MGRGSDRPMIKKRINLIYRTFWSIRPSVYRTFGLYDPLSIGPFSLIGLSDLRSIGPSVYRDSPVFFMMLRFEYKVRLGLKLGGRTPGYRSLIGAFPLLQWSSLICQICKLLSKIKGHVHIYLMFKSQKSLCTKRVVCSMKVCGTVYNL